MVRFFLQNAVLFFVSGGILTISIIVSANTKTVFERISSHVKAVTIKLRAPHTDNSLRVSVAADNAIIGFTKPIFKKNS